MCNKKRLNLLSTGLLVTLSVAINAEETAANSKNNEHQHHAHHQHGSDMRMNMTGMVMNENKDTLPKDCPEISEDVTIKVIAGTEFARPYPGTVFGFDQRQWQVKPCSRITVEFTNEDDIRHQWMLHGLPKYLYPEGMFHMELNGPGTITGTFIVPSSHYTYLVHCDVSQHMEKGMKAQLKVGNGRGDLPSIPGISAPKFADSFANSK